MQQAPARRDNTVGSERVPRSVWRLRMVAVCLGLTALAFLQDPGLIVIDTKVDLAIDPAGWLNRALHVWDPAGTFGQLQNQAYGYLWPMGPFFLAGKLLAIPAWVVQRLWWALVMSVAFTGVVRLGDRLGIGTPWARVLAGVAFALSPRMITELGPISVEAWPSALAPWVLVPLVGLAQGAALRPAVTRSALVVACAGGVNATAVFAVVPLALLWLAGLSPARLRLRALFWWCVAVACATAWWLVPLFLLGRFSPPFLDYIETGAVTTAPTDLVTVLRGASHWHAYLTGVHGPPWPAGWQLATEQALVIATLVLAGLGIAGLARRGLPHRWFLVTGLLIGLAMVGFGHVGVVSGLLAENQRAFLDGAGAPLRNVHKFDVILRLPLVLGLAYLLGLVGRAAAIAGPTGTATRPGPATPDGAGSPPPGTGQPGWGWQPARLRAGVLAGTALVAVAAVASPALAGGLAAEGSYREVPGYWRQATTWLDDNLGEQRVLVVPAARFPRYLWGSPSDEISQPLLTGRWGVRSSIPLTPPATIRLLDSIESVLASGAGSAGLADLLARSGVRYLLLRSDLDYGRSGATQPLIAKQALDRSPGIRPVTGFGPYIASSSLPDTFVDHGLNVPVRALEVYEVWQPVSPMAVHDADSLTTVVGGPESLLSMAAAGRLPAGPTILAGDRPAGLAPGPVVLTDGMRRREVSFGRSHDNASATLTGEEQGWLDAPARDYLPPWGDDQSTQARYLGITAVRASSSFAEAQPLSGGRPAHQPYAALDGDPATSWRSAPGTLATGQWLEVDLAEPRVVTEVRLTFDQGADSLPTAVTVSAGRQDVPVRDFEGSVVVQLADDLPTRRVRISIDEVSDVRLGYGGVGITELVIPDVTAERTLVLPAPPLTDRPAAVVLEAAPTAPACYFDQGRPVCHGALTRDSEDGDRIDRTLRLPMAGDYDVRLWVRPRPGPELNALLDADGAAVTTRGITPTVTASSVGIPDPAARAGVVADGDPSTVWYPSDEDGHPWLRMTWPSTRTVSGVRVALLPTVAASRPWQVTVIGADGTRQGALDSGGSLIFDRPMETNQITVLVTGAFPAQSYDPYHNIWQRLPIAVGELSALPAGPVLRTDHEQRIHLPCGSGPTVVAGGVERSSALVASRRELLELREVEAVLCDVDADQPMPLPAGEQRVVAAGSPVAMPTRLALSPRIDGATAPAEGGNSLGSPVRVIEWSATVRRLDLGRRTGERVLTLRENANPAWRATAGDQTLSPLVIDGWQQGWLVPAGVEGEVVLHFGPDRPYTVALGGGALLLAGLGVAASLPAGRGPGGRPTPLPFPARRRRFLPAALVGGIALVAVGGPAALGMLLLVAAGAVVLRSAWSQFGPAERRRIRRSGTVALRWLPVLGFAVAGWLALAPERNAALPQLTAVGTATVLWLSLLVGTGRRRGQRRLQRWIGRSTR